MSKHGMIALYVMAACALLLANASDAQTGSITVNINPADAVAAGAQWTVDAGVTWYNSGTTASGLAIAPGSAGTTYTVQFKDVVNWSTPSSKSAKLTLGAPNKTVPASYAQSICRYNPPFPAPGQLGLCYIVGDAPGNPEYVNIQAALAIVKNLLDCEDDPEYCMLIDQLKCSIMDINGPIVNELPTPNGMLDIRAELALIQIIYNNTEFSLPNGLTHARVAEALVTNYTVVYDLVYSALMATGYCPLLAALSAANNLAIHLSILLASFATQGDPDSMGALLMIAGLLEQIGITPPDPSIFNTMEDGAFFGPSGDADGDGCTNREEYDAYSAGGTDSITYASNALNPDVHPEGCGQTEGEGGGEGEGEGAEGEGEGAEGEGEGAEGEGEGAEGEGEGAEGEGEGAEGEGEGAEGEGEGAEGEGEGDISIIDQNELAARDMLCMLFNAEWAFNDDIGSFTGVFNELVEGKYLEARDWTAPISGYVFALNRFDANFSFNADPEAMGVSGAHGYFIDKSGAIRQQAGAAATAASAESGVVCEILEEGEGGSAEGSQEGETRYHSADLDQDYQISLSDLLRVIQIYNADGFHCEAGSEDGYALGAGDEGCDPHDSDYAGGAPDWTVSLSELLRVIQFFHLGGYHWCPSLSTEDGYCPGQ